MPRQLRRGACARRRDRRDAALACGPLHRPVRRRSRRLEDERARRRLLGAHARSGHRARTPRVTNLSGDSRWARSRTRVSDDVGRQAAAPRSPRALPPATPENRREPSSFNSRCRRQEHPTTAEHLARQRPCVTPSTRPGRRLRRREARLSRRRTKRGGDAEGTDARAGQATRQKPRGAATARARRRDRALAAAHERSRGATDEGGGSWGNQGFPHVPTRR
jgi:hypothetical protein